MLAGADGKITPHDLSTRLVEPENRQVTPALVIFPRSGCRWLVTLVLTLICACGGGPERAAHARRTFRPPPGAVNVDAAVHFSGTQFIVENRSSIRWNDVLVEIYGREDVEPFSYRADT